MTKKNVKDWLKEHEQAMWHIAGLALGAGIGIGYLVITHRFRHSKDYVVQDETVKYILKRADKLEGMVSVTGAVVPDSFTVDQLGELGRLMADNNCSDTGWTHFIAIGKPINTK